MSYERLRGPCAYGRPGLTDDILKQRLLAGVICRSPLVLFSGWHMTETPVTERLAALDMRGVSLLMTNWWSIEDMKRYQQTEFDAFVARMLETAKTGGHNLVFLCNTKAECLIMAELGARAVLAPSNCLVNEMMFRPGAHPPFFDAVYNAQMAPFKRHELAAEVDSLLLIYGVFGDEQKQRFREIARLLPHAAMANGDPDAAPDSPQAYRRMPMDEVAAHYTMARTGLCLSASEGNMHAAVEYLVAGLPVVTTPSTGGRAAFFQSAHAITTPPKPEEIARAVRAFCRQPPDPQRVRDVALETVHGFRLAFAGAVEAMLKEAGAPRGRDACFAVVKRMSHELWYGQLDSTVGTILGAPGFIAAPQLLDSAPD